MMMRTRECSYKCTIKDCDMTFQQESHLKAHIKCKHTEERPFKCRRFSRRDFKCSNPQCEKTFMRSWDLKRHFNNQHGDRTVQCDHPGCVQKFADVRAVNRHKRKVHAEKRLACPNLQCSYRTNDAYDLKRHKIVHEGKNEKVPCSIKGCEYKGKNSEALRQHIHQHKTLLACPVSGCGRYVASKETLKNHLKLHNNYSGRPFQCALCSKNFQDLHQLKNHCITHTKEKPFECGHCVYAAARYPEVKTHIASKHASIEFPFIVHLLDDRECLQCDVTLSRTEFLDHCKGHGRPVVMM